jgi:hypothetical protein
MSRVTSILEPFPRISLGETVEQASFRVLEIGGRRVFRYRSEYLDSPGRDAYRAHLQGRRRRYKCRVRNYVDSAESHVEVKLKGSRGETLKYRAPYGTEQSVGDCADFLAACVGNAYGLSIDRRLRPVLEVEYRRITLVSLTSPERVTLDNALGFLDVATQQGRYVRDTQWIVETKSSRGQGFADARLRDAHVHPVNVSKYVLGVALTDPSVRVNDYMGLIRTLDAGAIVEGHPWRCAAA